MEVKWYKHKKRLLCLSHQSSLQRVNTLAHLMAADLFMWSFIWPLSFRANLYFSMTKQRKRKKRWQWFASNRHPVDFTSFKDSTSRSECNLMPWHSQKCRPHVCEHAAVSVLSHSAMVFWFGLVFFFRVELPRAILRQRILWKPTDLPTDPYWRRRERWRRLY